MVSSRAAIEPIIGRLKADYRLARNFLKDTACGLINVLMAAHGLEPLDEDFCALILGLQAHSKNKPAQI